MCGLEKENGMSMMDISNLSIEQLKEVRRLAWLAECTLDSWADEDSSRSEHFRKQADDMYELWNACTDRLQLKKR